jgi:hypothetical protein
MEDQYMTKSLIFTMIFFLIAVSTAFCLDIKVVEVQADSQAVYLRDTQTGEEWWAQVGDEVGGWQVHKISQESITLIKVRDGLLLSTKLPVGADLHPVQVE